MHIIPAPRRLSQEHHEFKASLGYRVGPYPASTFSPLSLSDLTHTEFYWILIQILYWFVKNDNLQLDRYLTGSLAKMSVMRKMKNPFKGDSIHWNKVATSFEREKHKRSEIVEFNRCPVDAQCAKQWHLQMTLIKRQAGTRASGGLLPAQPAAPTDERGPIYYNIAGTYPRIVSSFRTSGDLNC
jgi:hypothetical protein